MSVFYAIAGFFAHLLLVKLGAWGLVRNRLRRIALPFAVSYVLVMPLLIAPFIWAMKITGSPGGRTWRRRSRIRTCRRGVTCGSSIYCW